MSPFLLVFSQVHHRLLRHSAPVLLRLKIIKQHVIRFHQVEKKVFFLLTREKNPISASERPKCCFLCEMTMAWIWLSTTRWRTKLATFRTLESSRAASISSRRKKGAGLALKRHFKNTQFRNIKPRIDTNKREILTSCKRWAKPEMPASSRLPTSCSWVGRVFRKRRSSSSPRRKMVLPDWVPQG